MPPFDEHQFDQARRLEEKQREENIAEARRRPSREQITVNDEVVCRSCYEPLSAERLAAVPDAACCVECQELYERWGI